MQAVVPSIQSASRSVGSDNLTILTNMTCDWPVQTNNAPAPFRWLRWIECTGCHAKWIGAWQIPCGSWLHIQVRNERDVFISESSARSKQLLRRRTRHLTLRKKSRRHFQLGRRLMLPMPPPPLLLSPNACLSQGLTHDPPLFDAESSGFRQVFDTTWLGSPEPAEKA